MVGTRDPWVCILCKTVVLCTRFGLLGDFVVIEEAVAVFYSLAV
jgi:hypothetical protein